MRVVVVGGTGNVGTSVIDALSGDEQVTSIVGLARRLPEWEPPKTTWTATDIVEDDLVERFRGADVVIHLGWIFQPTHDARTTWRSNVLGSIRVFEAVAEAGVPALVYASSVGAYSPGPQTGFVDESWPTHALPTAGYGREKSYLERVLDVFERDHPDVRVVRMRPGFIFQEASAEEQRRLFAGPLLPNSLVRSSLIPVVPDVPGLRLQTLTAADAAEAYRLAVTREVRGPFNIAADPVVDAAALAELLEARLVRVPKPLLRQAVAGAWHLHLIPASPMLVDLALSLPAMDTSRARNELGWEPRSSSLEALRRFLEGLRTNSGGPTPPLRRDAGGRFRWREFVTGIGERDRVGGDTPAAGREGTEGELLAAGPTPGGDQEERAGNGSGPDVAQDRQAEDLRPAIPPRPATGLPSAIHLQADDYQVVGPDEAAATGVSALESIGERSQVRVLGPLLGVEDRRFEPGGEARNEPQERTRRLVYVLEGAIEYDGDRDGFRGTAQAGEAVILTQDEGVAYRERNVGDGGARVYTLVSPLQGPDGTEGVRVVANDEMRRVSPTSGVETTLVVERDHDVGELREFGDTRLDVGATVSLGLREGEAALLFCLDGRLQVVPGEDPAVTGVGFDDTVLVPPSDRARDLRVSAQAPSRVLYVVTGTGQGLRRA